MLFLTLAIVTHFFFVEGIGHLPLWKSLLFHHKDWVGIYTQDLNNFDCSVSSISSKMGNVDDLMVLFESGGVEMEMSVYSLDDEIVTFDESLAWNKSHHFEGHSEVRFTGKFESYKGYYRFVGNVSSVEEMNFAIVSFTPEGSKTTNEKNTNSAYKYGLAIGIPVVLAVVLIVAAAMIILWSVRKGYLRHIPWAYRNFRNPSRMDQEMNNTSGDEEGEKTGQSAVHM